MDNGQAKNLYQVVMNYVECVLLLYRHFDDRRNLIKFKRCFVPRHDVQLFNSFLKLICY